METELGLVTGLGRRTIQTVPDILIKISKTTRPIGQLTIDATIPIKY